MSGQTHDRIANHVLLHCLRRHGPAPMLIWWRLADRRLRPLREAQAVAGLAGVWVGSMGLYLLSDLPLPRAGPPRGDADSSGFSRGGLSVASVCFAGADRSLSWSKNRGRAVR